VTKRDGDVRGSWTRRYPPLGSALLAVLLALFVLPSALNVPQSNPTQTLEFAPVPPEDDVPPPQGNTESLSLGTSSTAPAAPTTGGEGPGPLPPPPAPPGVGDVPVTKRCVGNPPRQTEDPLAPPCVAHFEGDNFGPTYQGVAEDEIVVLIYHDCCIYNITSRGVEPDAANTVFDLWDPPSVDEEKGGSVEARALRAFQNYFNDRYQTYGRRAHFILRFAADSTAVSQDAVGVTTDYSAEQRRADAADDYERFQPFAVITYTTFGNEDAYLQAMAERGVMVFGSNQGRDAAFFRQFEPLVWGYLPSLQVQANQFSSWVCTEVVPNPVQRSGTGQDGQLRRLGLLSADVEGEPAFRTFANIAKREIEDCGGEFAEERSFPEEGSASGSNSGTTVPTENMSTFQQAGVTTIVWPGGYETQHSLAGAQIGYYPEWVLLGDRAHDGNGASGLQDQDSWRNAWVLTNELLAPPVRESQCAKALREGDPELALEDVDQACTFRQFYVELRMLFTGIQVAGPRLAPEAVDKGFHAIPAIPSTDPRVPACFFDPGDYTCVKDAARMWWDPDAPRPGSSGTTGCWRMFEGGRRYFAGDFPEGNVDVLRDPENDPCTAFNGVFFA